MASLNKKCLAMVCTLVACCCDTERGEWGSSGDCQFAAVVQGIFDPPPDVRSQVHSVAQQQLEKEATDEHRDPAILRKDVVAYLKVISLQLSACELYYRATRS